MKETLLSHLTFGLARTWRDVGKLELTACAALLAAFAGASGLVLSGAVGWKLLQNACVLAVVVVRH